MFLCQTKNGVKTFVHYLSLPAGKAGAPTFEKINIKVPTSTAASVASKTLSKTSETYYRGMSSEAARQFIRTGKLPAGTETFISPTKSFAKTYGDELFEITVEPGTLSKLESIGVRNIAAGHPYSHLPLVDKGWKSVNAFFKVEGTQVNIGLGKGTALDIFNSNIQIFRVIK